MHVIQIREIGRHDVILDEIIREVRAVTAVQNRDEVIIRVQAAVPIQFEVNQPVAQVQVTRDDQRVVLVRVGAADLHNDRRIVRSKRKRAADVCRPDRIARREDPVFDRDRARRTAQEVQPASGDGQIGRLEPLRGIDLQPTLARFEDGSRTGDLVGERLVGIVSEFQRRVIHHFAVPQRAIAGEFQRARGDRRFAGIVLGGAGKRQRPIADFFDVARAGNALGQGQRITFANFDGAVVSHLDGITRLDRKGLAGNELDAQFVSAVDFPVRERDRFFGVGKPVFAKPDDAFARGQRPESAGFRQAFVAQVDRVAVGSAQRFVIRIRGVLPVDRAELIGIDALEDIRVVRDDPLLSVGHVFVSIA